MNRHLCSWLAVALIPLAAAPQPPSTALEFEVASIKRADPDSKNNSLYTDRGTGLHVENFTLRDIITFAFNVRDFQLAGAPAWIETERYDIVAKTARAAGSGVMPDPKTMTDQESDLADHQLRERIRSLLTSRFGLVVHQEVREHAIFDLTIAKTGLKLKPVITPGEQLGFRGGRGRSRGFAVTMPMLATELSRITGRPVVDTTGLTGKYDYALEWSPDAGTADADSVAGNSGPTLFTALQEQLGLKLESSKGPVETYVIDKVDRPSEN
jgi:bla regulator protein BlaR1